MSEKKPFRTTELAGYFVGGIRIPSVQDADGNRQPKVGHVIHLTEEEAKYELLSGVIERAGEPAAAAPLSPPVRPVSKPVQKTAEAEKASEAKG